MVVGMVVGVRVGAGVRVGVRGEGCLAPRVEFGRRQRRPRLNGPQRTHARMQSHLRRSAGRLEGALARSRRWRRRRRRRWRRRRRRRWRWHQRRRRRRRWRMSALVRECRGGGAMGAFPPQAPFREQPEAAAATVHGSAHHPQHPTLQNAHLPPLAHLATARLLLWVRVERECARAHGASSGNQARAAGEAPQPAQPRAAAAALAPVL